MMIFCSANVLSLLFLQLFSKTSNPVNFMTLALYYLCPDSFASAFENGSHPASEMVSFFHSLLLGGSFFFILCFFSKCEEPHSSQGRVRHVCMQYVK